MFWPSQAVLVFAIMAAVPPLVALLSGHVSASARSFPISVLAAVLAGFTRLVPVAIVLLIVSSVVALRQLSPTDLWYALRRTKHLLLLSPFVALGGYVVWVVLTNNWSPPKILAPAFVESMSDQERNKAMTDILKAQFPDGTDEATLKTMLAAHRFAKVWLPTRRYRSAQAMPGLAVEVPCPHEPREMSYEFQQLTVLCGTRQLVVDWLVDPAGKVTDVRGSDRSICS